jgi:hypothetical protein
MVISDLLRVDKEFQDTMEKIRAERVVRGTDKRTESPRRITKMLSRMINADVILRNNLINVQMENDRKFKRRKK